MRAPTIEWPDHLKEMGPAEDPAIILLGNASIAGVNFVITAVRMHQGLRQPDYREHVEQDAYEAALEEMLDEVEALTGSTEPTLLPLGEAKYLLWMVPVGRE